MISSRTIYGYPPFQPKQKYLMGDSIICPHRKKGFVVCYVSALEDKEVAFSKTFSGAGIYHICWQSKTEHCRTLLTEKYYNS